MRLLVLLLGIAGCRGCGATSDQDLINQILDETIAAANERRAGGVVEHAAEAFKGPHGADVKECRRILLAYFLRNGWVRVFEQNRAVEVTGESASVKLEVVIAVGNAVEKVEDLVPTNGTHLEFDVTLSKIDGTWKYTTSDYRVLR